MAPILEVIPELSVGLVGVISVLVVIVIVILCADGGDSKKPKRMQKDDNFTDMSRQTQGKPAKLKLNETVPIQGALDQPVSQKKTDPKSKLAFDAVEVLQKAFKDDHSLAKLTIAPERLVVTEIIGQGNFGLVYKAQILDPKLANPQDVAVKTVHGASCTRADVEMFIRESARMRGFAHQNVMVISGIVTKDNRPYIVLPYMANGDLKSFVANRKMTFSLEDLLRYGYQVAQGMAYLSSKNFIHRDLAARNCMVTRDCTVKVADFGLSRDLYAADYYKMSNMNTPLPIRWVALECIMSSKFTVKSDVWSFGILLWELVTRGRTPYPDIKNNVEVVKSIRSGVRMQCPSYVTDSVNNVVQKCWLAKPADRPDFPRICSMLHYILEEEDDYVKPTKTPRK